MIAQTLDRLHKSAEYKNFISKHPGYYLVHCFCMAQEKNPVYKWEIGYYSADEDKLAIFETDPIKLREQEEVFKESGTVKELKLDGALDLPEALEHCNAFIKKQYPREIITNRIIILQNTGKPIYNITHVTMSLSILNVKLDAATGEVESHSLQNIMSLKKQ